VSRRERCSDLKDLLEWRERLPLEFGRKPAPARGRRSDAAAEFHGLPWRWS